MKRILREAVADSRTVYYAPDEAGFFEDLQVLRHRRLCQGQFVDDLSTKTLVTLSEEPEDFHPRWMA